MSDEEPRHDLPTTPETSLSESSQHAAPRRRAMETGPCPLGLASLTVSYPEQYAKVEKTAPSRWTSPEYIFYAVSWAYFFYSWVSIPMRLSDSRHRNYPNYAHLLSSSWLGGHVDVSDAQYRQFRTGLLPLTGLAGVYLLLSRWYARNDRGGSKLQFILVASVTINILLHGLSSAKVMAILVSNYTLAHILAGRRGFIPLIWAVNVGLLFVTEIYDGYRYATLMDSLAPLDRIGGLMPRWHILFNFSMLRIVSFCVDLHWARAPPTREHARLASHRPEDYTLGAFIAYALYPPLYIAGPIMPFDDFLAQLKEPPIVTTQYMASYAIRLGVCLMTMEWIMHNIYVVAIKNAKAWQGDSPAELSMIGMWNLIVIWLKLLIPWRFFRLWALLDGVDPPENMVRCVINSYSTMGFWRSWHRSFNRWIIRYLYAPLGGSVSSRLLIFTFVAVWHDLRLHLLVWGWAISIFIMPEYLARRWLPAAEFGTKWWYRQLCALGCALNLISMITANLIGFALGHEGALYLARQMFAGWEGLRFAIVCVIELFVLCQLNLEYREEEARHGIQRKC